MKLFQSSLLDIGKATHAGTKRAGSPNQDSLHVFKDSLWGRPTVLVIADGMGGYKGGAQASKCVIDAFAKTYKFLQTRFSPEIYLRTALQRAHSTICQLAKEDDQLGSMGSTVVAVVVEKNRLCVLNVGDSRLYLLQGKKIKQLSKDQSVVAELVRQGEITKEEAQNHPRKNFLTMSITAQRKEVIPILSEYPLEFEDVIVLCSDGLWGVVPEAYIRAAACQLPPQAAANHLVHQANTMGGPDNISVIVARQVGNPLEIITEDQE